MTTYHRFTNGTVDTGVGFMMCADCAFKVKHYGQNHYKIDTDNLNVITAEELIEMVTKRVKYLESLDCLTPIDLDNVSLFNPKNITDSAGYWDDLEAISWIFDQLSALSGVDGVVTNDGFISFNARHFQRA